MASVISTMFDPRINAGPSVHGQSFIQGERIRQDELLFTEKMFYADFEGWNKEEISKIKIAQIKCTTTDLF